MSIVYVTNERWSKFRQTFSLSMPQKCLQSVLHASSQACLQTAQWSPWFIKSTKYLYATNLWKIIFLFLFFFSSKFTIPLFFSPLIKVKIQATGVSCRRSKKMMIYIYASTTCKKNKNWSNVCKYAFYCTLFYSTLKQNFIAC